MPDTKINKNFIGRTVLWLVFGFLFISLAFIAFSNGKSEKIFSFILNRSIKSVCKDCLVSMTDFKVASARPKSFQITTGLSIGDDNEEQPICHTKSLTLDFDLSKILSKLSIPVKLSFDSLNFNISANENNNLDAKSLISIASLFDSKNFLALEISEIKEASFTLDKVQYLLDLKKTTDDNVLHYFLTLASPKSKASIEATGQEENGVTSTSYKLYNLPAELLGKILSQNKLLNTITEGLFVSGKIDTKYGPKIRALNASFYNQAQDETSTSATKFLVELSSKDWHNRIHIDKLNLSFPNEQGILSAKGYIRHFPKLLGDKITFFLEYKADEFNLKTITSLWPQELAQQTRIWTNNSVKSGQIKDLKGEIYVKDIFASDANNVTFKGKSKFQGLDLKYMPDLPQIDALTGIISFDNSGVVFDVQGGKMTDVSITKGSSVTINLQNTDYPLIVDAKAKGPIKDFIDFISQDNLSQLKKKKIDLKTINGVADTQVSIRLPLSKEASLDNLTLDVKANLTEVEFHALDKLSLTGPLSLAIHDYLLSVTGSPLINNHRSEFNWQTHLKSHREFDNKLIVNTVFDASQASISMLYDKVVVSDGKILSKMEYIGKDDKETFIINANLDAPSLYVRDINLVKSASKKASFDLIAINNAGQGWKTQKCDLISDEENIKSSSYFELSNNSHEIKKFESLIQSRDNNVKIDLIFNKTEGKYLIHGNHITPNKSHLLELLNSQNISKDKKIFLEVKIDKATMKNNIAFSEILGQFECHHNNCRESSLRMKIGDKKNPNSLLKVYKKNDAIILRTNNAAALLKGLDTYNNIEGGSMIITLRPAGTNSLTKNQFTGSIYIKDFKAIKTPIIAKLILMTPFTQIVEQLQGQDLIRFKDFSGSFTIKNNIIELHDSIATGDLLSATIKGNIDLTKQTLDLQGKLIPKCLANKLMAKIQNKKETNPDKYQIATDYTVSGKLDDPKIHVNPISVLVSIFTKPLVIL
jgi:hypothetical protein